MKQKFLFICFFSFLSLSGLFCNSVSVEKGLLKLVIHGDTGTFSLYSKEGDKKYVPLLSDYSNSSSTVFSLMVGNRVYRLVPGAQVRIGVASLHADSLRLEYTIKNTAKIFVDFTLISSKPGEPEDAVEILFHVQNIGKDPDSFALKAVFDTILGEAANRHFSTLTKSDISTESVFLSMAAEKWIVSADTNRAVCFLLDGGNISSVQQVTLANRLALLDNDWLPKYEPGRTFSTANSANDSALQVLWPRFPLEPEQLFQVRFYITTAQKRQKPPVILPQMEKRVTTPSPSEKKDGTSALSLEVLPPAYFDPEYVQSILRRISEMQENPSETNIAEIKRLNQELDLILEYLGSK